MKVIEEKRDDNTMVNKNISLLSSSKTSIEIYIDFQSSYHYQMLLSAMQPVSTKHEYNNKHRMRIYSSEMNPRIPVKYS